MRCEHMPTEHKGEVPAICFVCSQPIEEMLLTPVYAKVHLHRPLTVYTSHDRAYQYLGTLRTLPITYLCPRHAPMFDVEKPWVAHWPLVADDLKPEDAARP